MQLFYSIKIRACAISHQMMSLNKNKDEEGTHIYAAQVIEEKDLINTYFKKLDKLTKKIEQTSKEVFGIGGKEWKELEKKVTKARKPDPDLTKLFKANEFDTEGIVTGDGLYKKKLCKPIKTWYLKALKKKKAPPKKKVEKKDDATGEGMEGPEDGDMEGMDGEGMDGEGDMEGAEGAEAGEGGEGGDDMEEAKEGDDAEAGEGEGG